MAKFTEEQNKLSSETSPGTVALPMSAVSYYPGKDFVRVNEHFEKTGSLKETPLKLPKTKRTDENFGKIDKILGENTSLSIRKLAPQLSLSASTVWRILRFDLGRKFYRPSTVQPLNESHVEQRKKFCTWILEQPLVSCRTLSGQMKNFRFEPETQSKE